MTDETRRLLVKLEQIRAHSISAPPAVAKTASVCHSPRTVHTKEIRAIPGAKKAVMPAFIAPQSAILVDEPPPGDDWIHEIKFDGYRMLCHLSQGRVRFWSRNEKDWTDKFPRVALAITALDATSAIIDGEIIIKDADGRSSFQTLQRAIGKFKDPRFVFEAFDVLYLDGFDLTRASLRDRKRLLQKLVGNTGMRTAVHYSAHHDGEGELFYSQACKFGFEGIVSKRADSPYASIRNQNWLKVKCTKRQEFVIAGYTRSEKGLPGFGALILAVYEKGDLIYAGRVGTGFTLKERAELGRLLDKISRPTPPFVVTQKGPGLATAVWAEPKLVAEVTFTEWTSEGSIRHPSFIGLRADKKPADVRRELPRTITPTPGKRT